MILGLDLRASHLLGWHYHLSHSANPFFGDGLFGDRVSNCFLRDWLPTVILLISASGVARITGVNYKCLARNCFSELSGTLLASC
jgi:hypothetical protein